MSFPFNLSRVINTMESPVLPWKSFHHLVQEEAHVIIEASKLGDFKEVIRLSHEEGIHLLNEVRDRRGKYPLHYACEHCQPKYVGKLVATQNALTTTTSRLFTLQPSTAH